MHTLLRIDSSPLSQQSVSRQLTGTFVTHWKSRNPEGVVIDRDLARTPIAPVTADWVGAAFTPAEARSPEQKRLLALSDCLLAELDEADEYVFGVPMHNFSVPAVLKLWIDQIARAGRTFSYVDGVPKGLLVAKKATFLVASGAVYDAQTQLAAYNFVEPYLRSVFAFLGVTDVAFLTAGGTSALGHGKDREVFLRPHLEAIEAHVQSV